MPFWLAILLVQPDHPVVAFVEGQTAFGFI